MNTVALLIAPVTALGLIYVVLRRDLAFVPRVQLAGISRDRRRVQRTFAVAGVLALLLQMVHVNMPSPSETTASLISKAPAPLNTTAPFLSQAMAPLDRLVPPFSNIQPVFANPTVGITITKSAPASVDQNWGGDTEITYQLTLTNPSAYTITVSSQVTDSVPLSTTYKGGNPGPGWRLLSGAPVFELTGTITSTVSYVGLYRVAVDKPVPDGTIVTNTGYCFTGTVGIGPTQFCESTPITTEVKAPNFRLTESWASALGSVCAGQRLTYTITISNPGRVGTTQPFTITGIITGPLVIYTNTLSPDASWSGNTITWSITSDERFLDAGGTDILTRTFAVSVPASLADGTYLTNTYTIASPEVAPTQNNWSSSGVRVSRATAAFTSTSPVCVGGTVVFTNTSEGATAYQWNFGDGSPITTTVNPTHVYAAPGSYTVWLTATGACGTAVTQTAVTVNPLPSPSIAASPGTQVCYGRAITFTCSSCAGIPSYFWDFGDSTTSSLANPLPHTYGSPGTYTVTLVVTSSAGCSNFTTRTVSIEDTYASFSRAPSGSVCTGATVQFTDTSTTTCCSLVSREWNFGDGSPVVTATNPSHVFTNTGSAPLTRTVTLTVTNGIGCTDVTTGTVTVNSSPQAGFSRTPGGSVCANQVVTFTNTSTNATTYQWNFGDGSPITTTVSPTHVFTNTATAPLTRTVTLTATGTCGTAVTTDTVTINPGTVAGFTPVSTTICTGQSVTFTNTSTGVGLSYQWNFGDGITSTVPGPTHVFTNAGTSSITRTVTLTATGTCGTAVTSGTVTVNPLPTAGFSRNPGGQVCVNQAITFTDTSSGSPTSWLWRFGDGITSTQQHPTHTYTTTGTFTVWLTATNACGSGVTSGTITIGLSPLASFTATTPVCLGQAMTFTNTGSVGTYLWSFGDGITGTVQNPSHTYVTTGTFTVWLTTTNTCGSAVTSNTVTVNPLPMVSFTSNSPVALGQTMYFTNTGSIGTYQWNLGDSSPIRTTPDVTHTYSAVGNYVVWLTTTLGTGCRGVYSATVRVTSTVGCEDAYEPDDDVFSATPVTFNAYMTGRTLHSDGDQDWVSFYVQAGEVFTITTYNLVTGTDTVLTLYDTDGVTQLAKSDDIAWPSDLSSRIVYTAPVAGTYYAMVAPYPDTGGCSTSYSLSLVKRFRVYLPIILKEYPPPGPTPTPTNTGTPGPTPTPTNTPTPLPPCAPVFLGTITVGSQPRGVVVDTTSPSRNRVYVANYGSNSISVINTTNNSVTTTIAGITTANGITFDPVRSMIWVTNYNSDTVTPIRVMPGDSFIISPTIAVGDGPWGIEYVNGAVYVANRLGNTVTVINATTRVTSTLSGAFSEPAHVSADPVTGKVYVTNFGGSSVTAISGGSSTNVINIPRSQPYGVAVDSTRNVVYAATVNSNSIVAINGADDTVLGYATFQRGNDPLRPVPLRVLAFNPHFGVSDGGHLWTTTATGDGSEKDQALLVPKGWVSYFHKPIPYDVGPNPREGIDIDLITDRVYVTSEGDNTVRVFGDNDTPCYTSFSGSPDEITIEVFTP